MLEPIGYSASPVDRHISPFWRSDGAIDFAAVSEMDLRYEYFWSTVDFVVQGCNIGKVWGSIPLLDFVASLTILTKDLEVKGRACIDFTESSDVVILVRRGDVVEISFEPPGRTFECDLSGLLTSVRRFIDSVVDDLAGKYPSIRNNEFFVGLRPASG